MGVGGRYWWDEGYGWGERIWMEWWIWMGAEFVDMDGVRGYGWGMWGMAHFLKWDGVGLDMGMYYTLYQL